MPRSTWPFRCSLLPAHCWLRLSLSLCRFVAAVFASRFVFILQFRAKLHTAPTSPPPRFPPPHTLHTPRSKPCTILLLLLQHFFGARCKKQLGNHCDFRRGGGGGVEVGGAGDPRETIAAFGCSHMWEQFPTNNLVEMEHKRIA